MGMERGGSGVDLTLTWHSLAQFCGTVCGTGLCDSMRPVGHTGEI